MPEGGASQGRHLAHTSSRETEAQQAVTRLLLLLLTALLLQVVVRAAPQTLMTKIVRVVREGVVAMRAMSMAGLSRNGKLTTKNTTLSVPAFTLQINLPISNSLSTGN